MSQRKIEQGFSLIEILVAIVIICFGLLGVAGLLTTGLKNTHSSQYRTQASFLAYDMAERMRQNRQVALNGEYSTSTTATNTIAANDKTQWQQKSENSFWCGNSCDDKYDILHDNGLVGRFESRRGRRYRAVCFPGRALMRALQCRTKLAQTGLSIVELMVAMALGLLIIGGILYTFISSRPVFTANDAVARIQEEGARHGATDA
jgi:type IV pilus modification protein PilV